MNIVTIEEKRKKISVILSILYFSVSITYVETLKIEYIKFIVILIMNLIIIVECVKNGLTKKDFIFFVSIIFVLIFSVFFHKINFSLKLTSVAYYITLLLWIVWGYQLISSIRQILFISIGIGIAAILGLFLTKDLFLVQLTIENIGRKRAYGGFVHPNTLGSMLSCAIIGIYSFLIFYKFPKNEKNKKYMLWFFIAVLIILLYLTNSRTSMIITATSFMVMNFYKIKKLSKIKKFIIYFILIILMLFISYYFFTQYIANDEAFQMRIIGADSLKEQTSFSKLIFGRGMTNSDNMGEDAKQLEIAWATLYYKNGFIGIIIYLILLLKILIRIMIIKNNKHKWLSLGFFVAFLLSTIGESYMVNITNVFSCFFWIILSSVSSKRFILGDSIAQYINNTKQTNLRIYNK